MVLPRKQRVGEWRKLAHALRRRGDRRFNWGRVLIALVALFFSVTSLLFHITSDAQQQQQQQQQQLAVVNNEFAKLASNRIQQPEDCHVVAVTGTNRDGTRSLLSSVYSIIQNYSETRRNLCIFVFTLKEDFFPHVASLQCAFSDLPLPNNVQIFVKMINKDNWHPLIFSKNLQDRAELNSDYNWFRYYLKPADVGGNNKIIWFDTDVIVRGNVAELHDWDMQGHVAAGAVYMFVPLQHHVCSEHKEELDKIPMGENKISPLEVEGHFNTGIFVFDLEEKIKQGILEEWARLEPIHNKQCLWKIDQTAFTLSIHGLFSRLPDEWNHGELGWLDGLERSVGKEPVDAHLAKCWNAKAMHWNGGHKPWHTDGLAGCASYWHDYDIYTLKSKEHCVF